MNIQDLVSDREICQEAKEKGVVIESEYWWVKCKGGTFAIGKTGEFVDAEKCPAHLTDEILKVLPWTIGMNGLSLYLTIQMQREVYCVGYERRAVYDNNYHFVDKKLSNALLLLVIKLKEEGVI